jgi:formylmethanofuran dehydrogenase subunit C
MGAEPNHKLVEELAAQVVAVAYRQESRGVKGAEILRDKDVSMAVRKMMEENEAKPSTKWDVVSE